MRYGYHADLRSMALCRMFLGEGNVPRRAVILQSAVIAPEHLTKVTSDQASILFRCVRLVIRPIAR